MMRCEECGAECAFYKSDQRFCCYQCRQDWHKRRNREIKRWWNERATRSWRGGRER
jgi:hypothetical protein